MDVQVMEFWSRVVGGGLVGVAILFLVWGVARWRPGRSRRFCPGVRVRGLSRLSPARWVTARVCGYDLAGLPEDGRGQVCCPECGRELVVGRVGLRSAARWRPGRLGVAVFVFAGLVLCAPMLKTRSWQRLVPTTVLIGVKRAVGTEWMPTRLRRELDRRIGPKEMWAWQVRWVIPGLQRDLREDKAHGNAYRAREFLVALGEPGRRALERSLHASDRQERQLAAAELRSLCWDRTRYKDPRLVWTPSDDLLRVTVEGLASDQMSYGMGTVDNAWGGFAFLQHFPERARGFVAAGLRSGDRQQRMLCAMLVGLDGDRKEYDRAIPILVSHLADNRVDDDARTAASALARMGADAVPSLIQLRSMGDPQQRGVAAALLQRLDGARAFTAERAVARVVSPDSGRWGAEYEVYGGVDERWGR